MKRNYFLAIAVAGLMLASEVAWAADVTFSGQFRPRFNHNEDFTDTNSAFNNFDTRVRLNANANVNANTNVFIQMQSVGTWGDSAFNRQSFGDAASASDDNTDVGLHQAYLTLKNFMGKQVDAKIGRQEVVLDGHRLFGHTGWTQGAQSSDAIRLTHAAANHTLNYIYVAAANEEASNTNTADRADVHVLHANTQGIMGGNLSGYFVIFDDDSNDTGGTDGYGDNGTFYTIGARQKGKINGLDYRVEYYHQFGEGASLANNSTFTAAYDTGSGSSSTEIDMNAHMFGMRIGKTFKNSSLSPTITLWYDRLSGTDDNDVTDADWGTFHTLYDTGHKFYGFMDLYLSAPGANTQYMGLQDIALKTKWKVSGTNTFKLDLHHFRTATDLTSNSNIVANMPETLATSTDPSPDLGTELDLTLVHKYDANTKIVAGFSHYWSSMTFAALRNSGNNADSDWMYLMVDTKF